MTDAANPAILGVQARRDRELRGALTEDRGVNKALERSGWAPSSRWSSAIWR